MDLDDKMISRPNSSDKKQELNIESDVNKKVSEVLNWFFDSNTKMRIEWFESLNKVAKPGSIVLVGDSITQEFCIHEMLTDKDINICNRGIGGDTTFGLLSRINCSIIDINPSKVFLLIGINDFAKDNFSELASIEAITKIISITNESLPDTGVYLMSLLPVNECMLNENPKLRSNVNICSFNHKLAQIPKTLNCIFLNIHDDFCDTSGDLLKDYTRDGLHLNPKGYSKLLNIIYPLIKS